MTDKTEIQNELALKLARISEKLTFEESIKYFHAFWSIMSLHWELIDRLRMDKFYRLMRCVIKQSFQTLDKEGWDEEKVKIYTTMLKETALKYYFFSKQTNNQQEIKQRKKKNRAFLS